MKVIGVISSSSRNKNTAKLVIKALEGARQQGAEIEEIFLPEFNLQYCKGCMECLRSGKCILNDDIEAIRNKFHEADGIILGAPTHGLAPNAMMKNILDRIGVYSVYTGILSGKYFVGISTAGAMGAKRTAKLLAGTGGSFFGRSYKSGALGVSVGWNSIDDYPEHLEKAYKLGLKLVDDIKSSNTYSLQGLFDRIINELVVKKVIINNILSNKDGKMAAVYRHHVSAGRM